MSNEAKAPETKTQAAKAEPAKQEAPKDEAPKKRAIPANGFKLKRNEKEVMHPFLGTIDNEMLKNPVFIHAIDRLDAKGETTDFFGTNIEPA